MEKQAGVSEESGTPARSATKRRKRISRQFPISLRMERHSRSHSTKSAHTTSHSQSCQRGGPVDNILTHMLKGIPASGSSKPTSVTLKDALPVNTHLAQSTFARRDECGHLAGWFNWCLFGLSGEESDKGWEQMEQEYKGGR